MRVLGTIVLCVFCAASGCAARGGAPQQSTDHHFESPDHRICLRIPDGWHITSGKYILRVESTLAPGAEISLDVPRLPPHLPGMIRMSLVQNGFVNDLKEQFKDVAVVEEGAIDVPDAQARMLLLTWRDDAQPYRLRAVLIIHAGRVYILRGTAPAESFGTVDEAFEAMLNSLEWTG